MSEAPPPVATRRVFFIPGFDPTPPRAFRERYRREGARQAAISGYALTIEGAAGGGWRARGTFGARDTLAEIEVLGWSDIVRASMRQGIVTTYRQLLRTALVYVRSGALFRLMRLRKGPVIAALYPVAVLLLQLLLALLAGGALAWAGWGFGGAGGAVIGIALGVGVAWRLLRWFQRHDGRILAHYLMHDYAFAACENGAYPAALEARIAGFADRVAHALSEGPDEVLVVGHSSGAYLGISVLSDLLRAGRVPEGARLSLLTLGQVVPMVSFLPDAKRLRDDLATLAASDAITWVDVTAPGDGCAFALCDPVSVSGVAPAGKRWPLVLSAAFTQTLSPEAWARLRWRFFETHFQYLNAFDRPGDYDYFAITAGPLTLADRYAGRAPSKSRIEAPVNRHTSRAA